MIQTINVAEMEDIILAFRMERGGLGDHFLADLTGDFFLVFFIHLQPFRKIRVYYTGLDGLKKARP
jgi:hypothetical protein